MITFYLLPVIDVSRCCTLQPCGGAIPLCMIEEFDLPMEIIDRKVTKMKMISPSNRVVDVGQTMSDSEYIGMCRREVFDEFLRKRASESGATTINGLFLGLNQSGDGPIQVRYSEYENGAKVRFILCTVQTRGSFDLTLCGFAVLYTCLSFCGVRNTLFFCMYAGRSLLITYESVNGL